MERKKIRYVVISVLTVLAMMLFAQNGMAGEKLSGDEKAVIRFNKPSEEIVKEFSAPNYDVAAYRPGVYLDIVMTIPEFRTLRSRGLDARITQTESRLKNNLKKKQRDALEGYRDYEQMLAELRQIEADHPDICKLYDIGDSWGKIYFENGDADYADFNHDIWAMKVSDNVNQEEDEPGVYYMGEHHAREPISMEMTMTILNHIVDNYGTDEIITSRVNDTQIWFVPLVNPNGHKIVTSDIENMWRKNIRDNNGNGQFDDANNADTGPDGVDLNRNYGFDWGPISTSNDPESGLYHGPEPWSEPEVQAVKNFLDSHHLLAGISYHTYGEWVLYPYGNGDGVIAPDRDALEELAVRMAEATPGFVDEAGTTEYPHGHYDPAPGWGLYPVQGDHNDYAYGVNGSFSFTVEMAREFIPPADAVKDICNDNLEAAMILLSRPWHSTLTGYVTDAATGEPLEAEIVIHGIDDTMKGMDDRFLNATNFRHPYRSNKAFGHYYRMLTDGTYAVTFRAAGYKAETRENIQITSAGQTSLDVALEKSVDYGLGKTWTDPVAMPHSQAIFVNAGATGSNQGSSWTDAFAELQTALNIALPGDEIWVAAGTYTPDYDVSAKVHTGDREATFQLVSGVAIYGGFDGMENTRDERNSQDNPTLLSGEIMTPDGEAENCYHVVTGSNADDTAVLDGFTITGGYAVDASWQNQVGGGMLIEDGSPTLVNIIFEDNYADYRGGAMYNEDAYPMLTNVIFRNNMGGDGAGIFNYRSSPTLANIVFDANWGDYGGGMHNFENSSPILINTTFVNNDAEYGGGLYNEVNSNPVVVNSILWDNLAVESGDQIYDVLKSSEVSIGSETEVSFSIVEGGWDGESNIDDDPLFINADEGNLRLQSGSPAIDAGDNSVLPTDLSADLAGNPRVVGGLVDMGAFEKTVIIATYHSGDYSPADFKISLSELLRVIQLYNSTSYSCDPDSEDGYTARGSNLSCTPHNSDYAPMDWRISLSELLRMIQLYNSSGYSVDENSEDGVTPNN